MHNNKRRDFFSRLLRIQEIQQQIQGISQKWRQPAFTKKIQLIQLGQAKLQSPNIQQLQATQKHGAKTLVVGQRSKLKSADVSRKRLDNAEQIQRNIFKPNNFLFDDTSLESSNYQQFNTDRILRPRPYTPILIRNIDFIKQKSIVSSTKAINSERTHRTIVGKSMNIFKKDHRQSLDQTKQMKLRLIKQIKKNYAKPFIPPPNVSAKSYIICENESSQLKVIYAFNGKSCQQIASLTKIMTCILTIQLAQSLKIDLNQKDIVVGKYEISITGTSANLKLGQVYSLLQLMHGLMLPSGNDASLCLAIWGGRKLLQNDPYVAEKNCGNHVLLTSNSYKNFTKGHCCTRFVRQMNSMAERLEMKRTRYSNPHGLANLDSKSTSYDLALLCNYAMKNQIFRKIVSCPKFKFKVNDPYLKLQNKARQTQSMQNENLQSDDKAVNVEEALLDKQWENTHKLLKLNSKQYIGIKTGFTAPAGACLASFLTLQNREFIIIVLGCVKMNLRFKETEVLKKWMEKHLGMSKKKKKKNPKERYKTDEQQFSQQPQQDD